MAHRPDRQLLGPEDPPPFKIVNAAGEASMLLTCDHASWAVPKSLAHLGLDASVLQRHIGWDPGAAKLTRRLSTVLDAAAVLSAYSRLVVDCNREPGTTDSIPASSDGTCIPGNAALSIGDVCAREVELFHPYHDAISRELRRIGREARVDPVYVAVHSFTPRLNGFDRPWQVGVLWDHDTPLARPLIRALRSVPNLIVGDNEPYSGFDQIDYSRVHHASRAGLPYVLIEVRSDLISDRSGVETFASLIAAALASALATVRAD